MENLAELLIFTATMQTQWAMKKRLTALIISPDLDLQLVFRLNLLIHVFRYKMEVNDPLK